MANYFAAKLVILWKLYFGFQYIQLNLITLCQWRSQGGGGRWVEFHPPSRKKLAQTKNLFKIARVFELKK